MNYFISNVRIERTEKPVRSKFHMHAHNTYEIFCFLSGDADYFVEGNCYSLQPGDIVLMRKSESHHLILNSDTVYERIVVNFDLPFLRSLAPQHHLMDIFDDRPLGKYNHYRMALFPGNQWMYFLKKMCEAEDDYLRLAYLLPLLGELSECFETVKSAKEQDSGNSIPKIIYYINQNLTKKLSLSLLCDKFYVSKAHLNRIFKEFTGSTVWNYIIVKRLLLAREMLASGKSPTDVYAQCGFQDYTTFFRAYKNQFGVSPKKDQSR